MGPEATLTPFIIFPHYAAFSNITLALVLSTKGFYKAKYLRALLRASTTNFFLAGKHSEGTCARYGIPKGIPFGHLSCRLTLALVLSTKGFYKAKYLRALLRASTTNLFPYRKNHSEGTCARYGTCRAV